MKTVILTGYAGFIGSQLLRDLLDRGYRVIGIDNMSEGSDPDNFKKLKDNLNFKGFNRPIQYEFMDDYLCGKKVDYLINCAAQSHVDRSWDQVNEFIDSNIKGPLNLAIWALKFPIEKFVHVSTDEVYAESEQPFNEESEMTPQNIYSSSKASAEFFLRNYHKALGLPLVITNGANTYGPRQLKEKIIPKTVSNLKFGIKVPLYKSPAERMWLHVEDHSLGIIAAMEKGKIGESYCLAPDVEDEMFTEDLVKKICSYLGKDFNQHVEYVEDRLNYDLKYLMDNDKAKRELNWTPGRRIKDELPSVINWYWNKF